MKDTNASAGRLGDERGLMAKILGTWMTSPKTAWRRLAASLVAMPGALLVAANAMACPAQLPDGMHGTSVGADVFINGLRMSVLHVQAAEKVDQILPKVEKQWQADGFAVKRSKALGWQVLTVVGSQCLVTLQLADRGGAFGYFARSSKYLRVNPMGTASALVPAGAQVTSAVSSKDDGRDGLVISMTSARSVEELNRFFSKQLVKAKWSVPRSHTIRNSATGVTALFITAQRQREQIDIVLWSDHSTQVVMTLAEAI